MQADLGVDLLQRAEEGQEGGPAEMGDRAETGEETAVPHLLKVTLTHILPTREHSIQGKLNNRILGFLKMIKVTNVYRYKHTSTSKCLVFLNFIYLFHCINHSIFAKNMFIEPLMSDC